MKTVFLLFFLLATSIQGGFAGNVIVNPLSNPDLSPKARADLESRILQWLCPRIKMTVSSYIRSRQIVRHHLPPFFMIYNNMRFKLQSWLEQLTPAQKQKLDDALMASIVAYLKTHPNDFMVSCFIDNDSQDTGAGGDVVVSTINADVNDTASIQLSPNNSSSAFIAAFSFPSGTWSDNNFFVYKCLVKQYAASLSIAYWWDVSSVTYSHGGKQIVLTQKYPFYSSN